MAWRCSSGRCGDVLAVESEGGSRCGVVEEGVFPRTSSSNLGRGVRHDICRPASSLGRGHGHVVCNVVAPSVVKRRRGQVVRRTTHAARCTLVAATEVGAYNKMLHVLGV